MTAFQIDRAGVELIAGFEGFVDGAYNDSLGYATAGFGHLLHRSPATANDHRTYDGKGREFFLKLLHADIERVSMEPMRRLIRVPLNQHRVNALASLAFNCGAGCLMGTVGREVNARRFQQAADAFMLWVHPPELTGRRRIERALFLTPAAQRKVRMPWLRADERRWCTEYDRLLARNENLERRRALREVMHKRAVDIAHAAKTEGGWDRADRRHRFTSLMARSS